MLPFLISMGLRYACCELDVMLKATKDWFDRAEAEYFGRLYNSTYSSEDIHGSTIPQKFQVLAFNLYSIIQV